MGFPGGFGGSLGSFKGVCGGALGRPEMKVFLPPEGSMDTPESENQSVGALLVLSDVFKTLQIFRFA